jgi:putative component of membrane protein insertase Oxa1/YidC/SpoIIIJ protein YidD
MDHFANTWSEMPFTPTCSHYAAEALEEAWRI